MTSGRSAIHFPAFGGDALRSAGPRRSVQPDGRSDDRAYRIVACGRSCGRGPRQREYSGADGGRGLADDMAEPTLLLATDKRVLAAPAMNVRMQLVPRPTLTSIGSR